MNKAIVGLLVRHGLNAVGAVLVSKGLLTASMVEPFTGALLLVGSVVWSIVQKKKSGTLQ